MSGNICRCGAYPNILKAIREVHLGEETAATWDFAAPAEGAPGTDKEVGDETV